MSSHTHDAHAEHGHDDHAGLSRGKIWQVFFILLGITVVEFIIALYMVPKGMFGANIANPMYIILTLAKAFYIVAFFMHLKFEKVALVYSMVVPILFIIGLILVLTNESHYWVSLR
ncbi:cytochrome C oxidase subunit IV family protein [Mucilaginibacter myungsuensis]|uniref:Cytochrome C oxidase subunit IV family protein n=1 Tax=Mucilaginibacter myungsuensis TaxID=649104 RepID=A0A929L4R3_9SPHI|nr:cytochrome C oxidase subunit IV family protein [Mucilaginibacter myungsuensis]MBE9664439.1 cytochrome C oxidase subunit IV family protein [Mucilaginibacter myungsuensis]MDN3601416.1 cytochrome C oxidase subunit IV family protein [Mucilaginibacter myungsuensis]